MAQSGTPSPTKLTSFSSDLDESQNRSLGQVGGMLPPRGYATVLKVTGSHIHCKSSIMSENGAG